jgi:hypothetical protein
MKQQIFMKITNIFKFINMILTVSATRFNIRGALLENYVPVASRGDDRLHEGNPELFREIRHYEKIKSRTQS